MKAYLALLAALILSSFLALKAVDAAGTTPESNALHVAPAPAPAPGSVACTMEAKQCPDGSFVSRVGPHCEFAPCPTGEKLKKDNEKVDPDEDEDDSVDNSEED